MLRVCCFQFFYYRYVLGRAWAADSWLNALKVLVMGPGWQPGKPRLGELTDIPDVSGGPYQEGNKGIMGCFVTSALLAVFIIPATYIYTPIIQLHVMM